MYNYGVRYCGLVWFDGYSLASAWADGLGHFILIAAQGPGPALADI